MLNFSKIPDPSQTVHLFFDADDTLWDNASNYEKAHHDFVDLCESLGYDRSATEAMVLEKDRQLIEASHFGHRWYKKALVETYRELAAFNEDPAVLETITQLIKMNFNGTVALFERTEAILESLKSPRRRLFLFTVGNEEIQSRKILSTGIHQHFEEAVIGSGKTPDDYSALLHHLRLDPESCVMFGDSLYRDVLPAIESGMSGVMIRNPKSWAYENLSESLVKDIIILESFEDVPGYLERIGL